MTDAAPDYVPLPDAPPWFVRALAVPRDDLVVDVDGEMVAFFAGDVVHLRTVEGAL